LLDNPFCKIKVTIGARPCLSVVTVKAQPTEAMMQTLAVVFDAPQKLSLSILPLVAETPDDVVVDIAWSGISTGTERLLYSGRMPSFPGMGYPLVPGYEAVGTVRKAGQRSGRSVGEQVFVPGARCYGDVRGLFGGAAGRVVVPGSKVSPISTDLGADATLLALAATAHHAVADGASLPELIIGHGVVGRLAARIVMALGGDAPTVWELRPERRAGATAYDVMHPDDDPRRDYRCILDASGDAGVLNTLIGRLAKRGEIVLAGFYHEALSFNFPSAFMREARLRIAAEWQPDDMSAVTALITNGRLSLAGLVSHQALAGEAATAYPQAFDDPACLKMVLDWRGVA
jgi:bacteriochlorophyllide a dehydrogenase